MSIRLLLADDDVLVRSALALLLAYEQDIEVVGAVGDGEHAVRAAHELVPDVVLMDVRMPVLNGVEATARICGPQGPDAQRRPAVLVLTTYNVDQAVYEALRAGASGFLLKDAAPDELIAAVHAVASGEAWLQPSVARKLIDEFAHRPIPNSPTPDEVASLTQRERVVLVLMSQGLSNGEIARNLFVGEGTIKTHVSHILIKLGVRDRTQAVVAAYRCGLVSGPNR